MNNKGMMRAAVYHGIKDIRIEEIAIPRMNDEDILLKVNACAICGTDDKVFNYGYKKLTSPMIVGHEICGTIVEKGSAVKGYKIGERVLVVPIVYCGKCYYCKKGMTHLCLEFMEKTEAFGFYYPGGFAEYMAVPGKAIKGGNLIKVPDNVSDEEASIAEPMGCALNGQMLAGVGEDDVILIIGAGPMGCIHISVARALGVTKILVSEISEERLKLAKKFKADCYINPENEDLRESVMEATAGVGASVVIIAAASKVAQESALELVSCRGHINFFGGLPQDDSIIHLDSNIIHYKELYIHGSSGCTASHLKKCIDMISKKKVNAKKLISKIVSLDELPNTMLNEKNRKLLKIVVKP